MARGILCEKYTTSKKFLVGNTSVKDGLTLRQTKNNTKRGFVSDDPQMLTIYNNQTFYIVYKKQTSRTNILLFVPNYQSIRSVTEQKT
jgi:hypothetical protein